MVEPVLIISLVTMIVSLFTPITSMIGRIRKSKCGACQIDIDKSTSTPERSPESKRSNT